MFFFLSKTLSFAATPLLIASVCLLLSVVFKQPERKRLFFRAGFIVLLFFSNDFIANEAVRIWEVPVTPFRDLTKHYEYGILLTGVTKSEGGLTDRVFFQRGADRVTHTLQLYRGGYIQKILITGGSGRLIDIGVKEAEEMKSALVMMGVPDSVILTESKSRNTRENAVNSIAILASKTRPEACVLITSAYHLRRARACFAKLGWKTDVFSTDFLSHRRSFSPEALFVPRAEAMVNWNILIKEWTGYLAYAIAGYL